MGVGVPTNMTWASVRGGSVEGGGGLTSGRPPKEARAGMEGAAARKRTASGWPVKSLFAVRSRWAYVFRRRRARADMGAR